ncbi:MAG: hypothetical protein LRZ84_14670 [Desertifilum sp.]|nr:hypothetical protein [Desertifilum sp.]
MTPSTIDFGLSYIRFATKEVAAKYRRTNYDKICRNVVTLGRSYFISWDFPIAGRCEISPRLAADWIRRQDAADKSQPKFSNSSGLLTYREISQMSDRQLSAVVSNSEMPVCITWNQDSKILAANFPVSATNGKPLPEMIGESITSLWDEDELNRLLGYVSLDKYVEAISYWSYKWVRNGSHWGRVRQNLVGNFYAIEYMGVPCRMSVGVHAV